MLGAHPEVLLCPDTRQEILLLFVDMMPVSTGHVIDPLLSGVKPPNKKTPFMSCVGASQPFASLSAGQSLNQQRLLQIKVDDVIGLQLMLGHARPDV